MKPKPPPPADFAALRHRAEGRLRERHPETDPGRTEADTQRLLHELQVHQVELEMQNEELQRAQEESDQLLMKFTDLYDFSPIGYFTLALLLVLLVAMIPFIGALVSAVVMLLGLGGVALELHRRRQARSLPSI